MSRSGPAEAGGAAADLSCYAAAVRPFGGRFDPDQLIAQAETATGLTDWGGRRWHEEAFRYRFAALCKGLEEEAALSSRGRDRAHSRLHVMLCSRLRYLACRSLQPAIDRERILRPLIGTGMPRTGTTLLHGLLAQDPDNRSARTWEIALPAPPPEEASYELDPRNALYQAIMQFQGFTDPELNALHPFGSGRPEECIWMQEGSCGALYNTFFRSNTFLDAVRANPGSGYEWQVGQMQFLQSRMAGARWSLKAPPHLMTWDEMWLTFPDARVYMNHRDPAKVLPSIVSLIIRLRALFSDVATDPGEEARLRVARFSQALKENIAWRERDPRGGAIVDVQFVDLVAEPLETVRGLYDTFDIRLAPQVADRMARFLERERHGERPNNRTSLADVGLAEEEIEEAFAAYIDHFGVRRERRG